MKIDWGDANKEAFSATEQQVEHTYERHGLYTVTIDARDQSGQHAVEEVSVAIDPQQMSVEMEGRLFISQEPNVSGLSARFINATTGQDTTLYADDNDLHRLIVAGSSNPVTTWQLETSGRSTHRSERDARLVARTQTRARRKYARVAHMRQVLAWRAPMDDGMPVEAHYAGGGVSRAASDLP